MAINLLPNNLQAKQKQKSRGALASIISGLLMVVFLIIAGGTFSYRVVVTEKLKDVSSNLSELTMQLDEHKEVEGIMQSIHLKLNKIDDSGDGYYLKYGDVLEQLQEFANESLDLTSVVVNKGDQFQVTGKIGALRDLADYVASFKADENTTYQNFTVDKISFSQTDFKYSFTLSFVYESRPQLKGT